MRFLTTSKKKIRSRPLMITNSRPKNDDMDTAKPKHNIEFDLLRSVHGAEYETLKKQPHPASLEPIHKLTVELDKNSLTQEKYRLYARYQQIIHHESNHEINPQQFKRFLCSSPLSAKFPSDDGPRQTGSFHQLYRIDGDLVAFGVVDLLPNTVSSVYFVYDPDKLGKFGMGKISALREVAMCIEGGYKYYGLGISSCTFLI